MTDLGIFKKIWNFHLERRLKDGLSLERKSLLKDIRKASPKLYKRNLHFNSDNNSRNVLIIYNSQRLVPVDLMEKAVHNFQIINKNSNLNPIFVDVFARKFLPSQMKIVVFKSLLKLDFNSILDGFHKGYMSLLVSCVEKWFSRNKIDLICLFTSNSRLVEFYRLCAIKENIQHVEFLHGTCSDSFAEYLELLEAYSLHKKVKNYYVNLCPDLPQPPAIYNNLLYYDNKQVFFRNERTWENSLKIRYDVLIVGGNSVEGNYVDTRFFDIEISAMNDLLSNNLNVVYCPHPSNVNFINEDILPKGVTISMLYTVINSAKVIIGGDSCALFSSHLLGKSVLIFPEFWSLIPANLIAIFDEKQRHTYSIEHILGLTGLNNNIKNISGIKNTDFVNILSLYDKVNK